MNEQILALAVIARDEASATLAKVDAHLEGLGGKVGRTDEIMKGFSHTLIGFGTATLALAGGAAIGEFFGDAANAAIEEEAGIRRLDASLRANVAGWDGNSDAIEATIKKREGLAFSDDELRDSFGRLVASTHDTSGAFAIQATAMDLARFKNISLSDATDQLIKVNAGSYRSLKALGIQIDSSATSTEALARVQAVTAGQAEAYGETTAGAMQAAGVAMHDAQEEIGAALLPLVKELAVVVKNDLAPALGEAGGLIATVAHKGDDIAGVLNQIVALGPKLHNALVGPADPGGNAVAEQQAALGAQAYSARLREVDTALADGTMSQEEANRATQEAVDAYRGAITGAKAAGVAYNNGAAEATRWAARALEAKNATSAHAVGMGASSRAAIALAVALGTSTDANKEQKQAAADAAAEFKAMQTVFDGFNGSVSLGSAHMGVYSADLDNTAMRAIGLKANTDALRDSLYGLPTNISINIEEHLNEANLKYKVDTAPFINPNAAPGTGDADRRQAFTSGGDIDAFKQHAASTQAVADAAKVARDKATADAKAAHDKAVSDAKTAHDKAVRDAKQAAEEAARASAEAAREAFSAAKQYGDNYFDNLHQQNLKAIKDAKDRATAEISEERRAIDARLQARLALNAAPVSAAEKALHDAQLAEQRRDLNEALVNAQAGGDTKSIRSAQESLANFEAQQNIDRLRGVQATADDKARADAAKAAGALDVRQKGVDTKADAATEAENRRHAAQKQSYDTELRLLNDHLAKVRTAHATAISEINALYKQFGVDKTTPAARPGVIEIHNTTHLDGRVVAEVVDRHLFAASRIYQPSHPGSGF